MSHFRSAGGCDPAPAISPFGVILRHGLEAPVDLEAIAGELGIEVERDILDPDIRLVTSTPNGLLGPVRIRLNLRDGVHGRRFSLAHGLAHAILHKDWIAERGCLIDRGVYRSDFARCHETAANSLAVSIIMPSRLVTALWESERDVETVAARLLVSPAAARIRLEGLGLVPRAESSA